MQVRVSCAAPSWCCVRSYRYSQVMRTIGIHGPMVDGIPSIDTDTTTLTHISPLGMGIVLTTAHTISRTTVPPCAPSGCLGTGHTIDAVDRSVFPVASSSVRVVGSPHHPPFLQRRIFLLWFLQIIEKR